MSSMCVAAVIRATHGKGFNDDDNNGVGGIDETAMRAAVVVLTWTISCVLIGCGGQCNLPKR